MILDSSAVIAMVLGEPSSADLFHMLAGAEAPKMAAPTYVEASLVARGRRYHELAEFLAAAGVAVVDFTAEMAEVAETAHRRYGKGSGSPARLNLGDTFSYALAKVSGEPLLFVGEDFNHTDVVPALPA